MQTDDKNREPRHINRRQLPWIANKRKQSSTRKIYNVPGGRHRPQRQGLAGGSRGWPGGHTLAPTSQPAGCWFLCARGQESLHPRLSWGYGGSLHPSSGTAGGTEPANPTGRARHGAERPAASPPASPGSWQRAAVATPGPAVPGMCTDGSSRGRSGEAAYRDAQHLGCRIARASAAPQEGFGDLFWQGRLAGGEQTGERTEVSWQAGARRDNAVSSGRAGAAKNNSHAGPKGFPIPKKKGLYGSILPKGRC